MKLIFMLKQLVLVLSCCMLLVACTEKEPVQVVPRLEDAEVTLKIAVPDSTFEKSYRSIIEKKYPKLTLEFISEGYFQNVESGDWKDWLETHKPDLIVSLYLGMYSQLLKDGLLVPLDPLIKRDNVDLGLYVPSVIDLLRLQDDNRQLYGMTREFEPVILMYNTEHFDRLGIPYPSEKITWSELLQLAQRFQGDQVHGLLVHVPTPSRLLADIGRTEELRLYDTETGEVFVRTEEWKAIWEQVLQAYEAGVIQHRKPGWSHSDVAMILSRTAGFEELLSGSWKWAYFPINAKNPNESHTLTVQRPISIYNQSHNKEYAWELLKFLTSEDMIRYINKPALGIPNLMETILNYSNENANILYDVKPKVDTIPEFEKVEYVREFYDLGDRIFEAILQGNMTLDEGLDQFERELKELLTKVMGNSSRS